VGTGVGNALDRLAQYYIKLAEQTFPVIESTPAARSTSSSPRRADRSTQLASTTAQAIPAHRTRATLFEGDPDEE